MNKKFVILSIALVIVGAAALGKVTTEQSKEEQLQKECSERLEADMNKVGKLIAGETEINHSAAADANLEKELDKYKAQKETRELVFTLSVISMTAGGMIFSCLLMLWIVRGSRYLAKFFIEVILHRRESKVEHPAKTGKEKSREKSEQREKAAEQEIQLKKRTKTLVNSGWYNVSEDYEKQRAKAVLQKGKGHSAADKLVPDLMAANVGNAVMTIADEKTVEATAKDNTLKRGEAECLADNIHKTIRSDSNENALNLRNTLKEQAENLEKQVTEFKKMAQTVKQTALEHSAPLANTLKELTEQMAAIREYASLQQNRVVKLQDGYDWNIIRNFCLRIIRCIDNLESRIARLSEQGIDTTDLMEVRDELIFVLESSGVEQFEPAVNSDYNGQEKRAEAVKDKDCSDEPSLAGKIAEVVRPGYQYVIDEENVKVVRTAQVKLYG